MLTKRPAERSQFENMAIAHLEETFTKFASEMGDRIGHSNVEIRQTEGAVAASEADVQEKTAKLEASAAALAEAEAHSKSFEENLQDVERKLVKQEELRGDAA